MIEIRGLNRIGNGFATTRGLSMAFPTSVNSQITDAVTQSGVQVLGDAPAFAMAAIYQTEAQTIGIALQNAVANQQASNQLAQALITRCIEVILGPSSK